MMISQFEIWLANLNPQKGTEPGKKRPVLVVQTNFLNKINHPSTIVCPITSNVVDDLDILRVNLKSGEAGLEVDSDILIEQIRSIDNRRLINKLGELPSHLVETVKNNLKIVLDIM